VTQKDRAAFNAAKEDVLWVFQQLAAYLGKFEVGKKRVAETSVDGRAGKRRRH
jgi:hypothetical protein